MSSVWAEELCLPLTVCLCELREAGAESVGTGDGFLSDSLSPTPSLIQTLRKALFVGRMGSQAPASLVGTQIRSGWRRLCLGYRKFCSGALCSPRCRRGWLWIKAEDEKGWRDGTR